MNIDHAKRVLEHQEEQLNMLISSAFPSRYLKAADLSGEATTVTMTIVKQEQVAKSGDMQPVLYFREFKQGLVLNKTNAKSITKLYGDDTNRWNGQKVELFEAMVDFQGDVVAALRVRPFKDVIPWEMPPTQQQPSKFPTPVAGNTNELALIKLGEEAAAKGIDEFRWWRDGLTHEDLDLVRPHMDRLLAEAHKDPVKLSDEAKKPRKKVE